jgi:protein-S-isoprenylcysteine O-methyltransferase Ste14
MPRSPIGLGMFLGAALGFVLGMIAGFAVPPGAELFGLVSALFLAACGLIAGAVVGAVYSLAVRLSESHQLPTDGPEADYHDLPRPPRLDRFP